MFHFTGEHSIRAGREREDSLKNSLQNKLSGSSGAPVRQHFLKLKPCRPACHKKSKYFWVQVTKKTKTWDLSLEKLPSGSKKK